MKWLPDNLRDKLVMRLHQGRIQRGKGGSAPLQEFFTYMLLLLRIHSIKISFNDV